MTFYDRAILLFLIYLSLGAYYSAGEAHEHTHQILCQHGIELEGADCR